MDALIDAAARALAKGDALGALNHVALRDDAPALALRGIAMAQLGDLSRAKTLLRRAARAFGQRDALPRARCIIAGAEIALVNRDLAWPEKSIDAAQKTLEEYGDQANAAHARYLKIRRLILIGRLDEAERAIARINPKSLPAALQTAHELATAGIAIRRLHTKLARSALTRAKQAAGRAHIPALVAEVESAAAALNTPAACLIAHGDARPLLLKDVEALLASDAFVVDACRYAVHATGTVIPLSRRPVLFALVRALAEAWPMDVPREKLIELAFRSKHVDESSRTRLRVEMARLRKALRALAGVSATKRGFSLTPHGFREVVVLARTVDETHGAVLALLSDGEAWSSSALALALDISQRTVQRLLNDLAAAGRVQPMGHGRSRRWAFSPVPGFATALLLPTTLPRD